MRRNGIEDPAPPPVFSGFKYLLIYGLLGSAVLGSLFVAGFLQEWSKDGLPVSMKEAGLPGALEDPWIEVSLQRMALTLYDGDVQVKRYDIGYGNGPVGRRVAGSHSTPLGEFRILAKEKRQDIMARGSRFLRLDYPTEDDAAAAFEGGAIGRDEYDRIREAARLGEPPPVDTALGGPLGIQGNYFFFMDRRFTDGSVALSNADVNELFEHVPVGTRVVIQVE